jgi:hypothetical protein
MRRLSVFALAGTLCLVGGSVCLAQSTSTPELVTDRPDFTESSEVVGHRVVQIETGFTFEQTDTATRQITTPQMLVRIGIGSSFELRFAGDGFVSQSVKTPLGSARTAGYSDFEVGAKLKFLAASHVGVDMAVIPFLSVPTASQGFGTTGYDPGMKLTWARDLPKDFGLSGNFNATSAAGELGRAWERELSVSLGHDLAEGWGAYWEAYGTVDGDHCVCTLNTGISRAVGANSQFDVEVGRGISDNSQDWFVGVGFALRRLGR